MGAITFDTLKFTKRDIERLEVKIEQVETKIVGELMLVKWMLSILLGGVIALILKAFSPS